MNYLNAFFIILALLFAQSAMSLPIDWNGNLSYDMHTIKKLRGTNESCSTAVAGSECITDGQNNARFQSYVLKLNPTILVNDSVSIFGELSTGAIRGGFVGQDSRWGENANGSYYAVSPNDSAGLNVNQLYAKLYADTMLFKVGKFSKHFGLGALLNDGQNSFDRYFTLYDGFEGEFKLGNIKLTPFWAKLYTNAEAPTGKFDVIETGITALYEDTHRNLTAGAYYGLRTAESSSEFYGGAKTGKHDTNMIDLFIQKEWDSVSVAFEMPMLKGTVGSAYNGVSEASANAIAYILDTKFKANNKWHLGFNAGKISGDKGDSNAFEGMYLHPNYQIAHLMFRYNYNGFNDNTKSIFDSAMSNMTFYKFSARYISDAWNFDFAYIMAKAEEVASNGKDFYSHRQRQIATAAANQSDDLGQEFDFTFNYLWNPAVTISTFYAYNKVGSFYKFTNSSNTLDQKVIDSYGLKLAITF